ncbi:MAG: hypothetical protein AAF721_18875 [Myxococcota bacterium]
MNTSVLRLTSAVAALCLSGCFDPPEAEPFPDDVADASESDDGGSESDGEEDGEEDGEPPPEGESSTGEAEGLFGAEVTAEGLESLSGGFHYELWAIIDDAPATVGKFNVDAGGVIVDLDGIAIMDAVFDAGRDLSEATDFVLTIETAGDVDITPGVSKYLAGPLEGDSSVMVVGDGRALGDDYADAAGQFILATPTNGPETDEASGVWWLDLAVEPAAPGLVLPDLPEGWVYEGWAVLDGVPVTTGRFRSVDAEDLDAPFSGEEPGPMVPGEDFLVDPPEGVQFPADVRGATVVITIEPEPDSDPAPFTLKPLVAEVHPMAATHQSMAMVGQPETFPTMTVTLVE